MSVDPPEREEAQLVMEALEQLVSGNGQDDTQLMQIYLSLGIQLQRQNKALSEAGKDQKAKALAGAFEDVVERVSSRSGSAKNWTVQNWIAQTNLQLGQGLQGEAAEHYYGLAESIYRELLDNARKDPSFAPSELAILGIRKKIGDCYLAKQEFEAAFGEYTGILNEKPKLLELQQASAQTLQQWGKSKQIPEKLNQSIHGALPQANRRNLVWGWLKIASLADNANRKLSKSEPAESPKKKKYHDLFFNARLNVAQARYEAAMIAEGQERQKQLSKAKQSVTSMQRLYPNLGGPSWKPAYHALLQKIESESQ